MLRVLLVDDEPFILQGLSVLIDWEQEGYEIATAADGESALEYIRSNSVDLVITDIKMPKMSGLDLLEIIRNENLSKAYFVILSGYSDFSFAQKAMHYDCMDYILKPVEKESLLAIVRKVASLTNKNKLADEKQKKHEQAYRARNMMAMFFGKFDESDVEYARNNLVLSEGVRYVDIEFNSVYLSEETEEGELRRLQRRLYECSVEYLKGDGVNCIFDVSPEENSFDMGFIYCDAMAEKEGITEREYLERLGRHLSTVINHKVSITAGKKVNDISAISKSYSSACSLKLIEGFRPEKDIYFYEDEVQVTSGGDVLCKEDVDKLILAIEQNDSRLIRQGVEQLFGDIQKLGARAMKLNINYLLFQLVHLATEQDGDVNQEEVSHYITESTFEEGIIRGGKDHLLRLSSEYAQYLSQLRKNVSKGLLADIEREIKEHYTENITLRDLSKKYYVNSSYLGQIFRKKYGQSFKDYLSEYRINEATNLLLHTDKKISEIAEAVGYKDNDYFIQKFIEQKGCTPSKYRKSEVGK